MKCTAGAVGAVGPPELWELWPAARWTYEETKLPFRVLFGESAKHLASEGWAGTHGLIRRHAGFAWGERPPPGRGPCMTGHALYYGRQQTHTGRRGLTHVGSPRQVGPTLGDRPVG